MTKITFLGTGGGRFVVINQLRATGGIVIEMDSEMIHIDPGPGTLVRAKQFGIKLRKLTAVLISHAHPDHYADGEMVIEAMTVGAQKKKGIVIASNSVFESGKISKYHLDSVKKAISLKAGESAMVGRIKITSTPTKHSEPGGIGFVIEGSHRIGYTSDGEYFAGQENFFKGCDVLILNCLRPRDEIWPDHMDANQAKKLITLTKPKLAILNHFGMRMLKVAEREAAWITEQTGVKTIAARDGQIFEI
jgi:ribonuclease BN (tRNA processing enzyme)